jgi:hypothetical protein
MPLSEKTLAEMEAGALALAKQRGESELPPGYMEAMIRVQERHRLLKVWVEAEQITIECVIPPSHDPGMRLRPGQAYNIIHCGALTFDDISAEEHGMYPSELLIANLSLAIMSGQANKKREDYG